MQSLKSALLAAIIEFCAFFLAAPAFAQGQYCDRTNYSAQEITDAVNASPLRSDLKATSCSLGGLGRFESGGNKGIYNGSCCTGIFQLNNANVFKYAGTDRAGYGCLSLQEQVDAWARLTNDGYNTPAVRQLIAMGTFDGQRVDAGFIAACIQLGPGNCQAMVNSGRCSGFSDINGTTICGMANAARANATPSCRDGAGQSLCDMGPGDFPGTPVAAARPAPALTDVVVGPNQL